MSFFYIRRGDKTIGPYGEKALRKGIKTKKFRPTDDVRDGEDGQWRPLSKWIDEQRAERKAAAAGNDFDFLAELEAEGEVAETDSTRDGTALSTPEPDPYSGHIAEKKAMGALYSVQLDQQKNTGGMRCFNCGAWVLPIPFPFICLACKMAFPSKMALMIFLTLAGITAAAGLMLAFGVFVSV